MKDFCNTPITSVDSHSTDLKYQSNYRRENGFKFTMASKQ